jgi:hypothetical protein
MMWTIFTVLLVLWLFAWLIGHLLGGVIHVLLVLSIGAILVIMITGHKQRNA